MTKVAGHHLQHLTQTDQANVAWHEECDSVETAHCLVEVVRESTITLLGSLWARGNSTDFLKCCFSFRTF